MVTDSFTAFVKIDDIYEDIAEDAEIRFDISSFDKPLPKVKNNKAIGLLRDELGRQIMKESIVLRAKMCSYLKDDNDEDKKAKCRKKFVVKKKKKFKIIKTVQKKPKQGENKNCLRKKRIDVDSLEEGQKKIVKNNKLILKTQH